MFRRRRAWVAGLLLVFVAIVGSASRESLGQSARGAGVARRERAALSPGEFDVARSRVYVFVGKSGLGHEHGVEGRVKSGKIAIPAVQSAGEIQFDIASFTADTAAARSYVGLSGSVSESTAQAVNKNMLGPKVLDAARFPTATFKVDTAQPLKKKKPQDADRFQLDGEFTLHGVTRKIRVIAEQTAEEGMNRLRGGFTVRQTDYGITPYSQALGAVGVADELKIWGDFWLGAPATETK